MTHLPPSNAPGSGRLQSLQLFRGIAAIAVLLYHTGVISSLRYQIEFAGDFFKNCHIGVDFFFVLSGFIIFHSHRMDIGAPPRLPRYILKRFFRVWPLLAVVTTVKLCYMLALGGHGVESMKNSPEVIISSYFMLPVPAEYGGKPILDVAWTLSFEMLFYLVFSLAILFGKRVMVAAGIVWATMIMVCSALPSGDFSHLTSFLFNPHSLQFIMGCIVAEIHSRTNPPRNRRAPGLVLLVGLILLAVALTSGLTNLADPSLFNCSLLGVAFSLIIFGAVKIETCSSSAPPACLTFFGDASYSIYLVHTSIQVPAVLIAGKFGAFNRGVDQISLWLISLVALGGGIATYLILEKNFNRYFAKLIYLKKANLA